MCEYVLFHVSMSTNVRVWRANMAVFIVQHRVYKLDYHHCCWPQYEWRLKSQSSTRESALLTHNSTFCTQTQPYRHEAQQHGAKKHVWKKRGDQMQKDGQKMTENGSKRENENQKCKSSKRRTRVRWGRGWIRRRKLRVKRNSEETERSCSNSCRINTREQSRRVLQETTQLPTTL